MLIWYLKQNAERRTIFDDRDELRKFLKYINKGQNKTGSICVINKSQDIDDDVTEFINIDEKLVKFLHCDSSCFFLTPEMVKEINTPELAQLKRKIAAEKAEAQKQIEFQQRLENELRLELKRSEEALKLQKGREAEQQQQRKRLEEELRLQRERKIEIDAYRDWEPISDRYDLVICTGSRYYFVPKK